jgi:hypothetical protein
VAGATSLPKVRGTLPASRPPPAQACSHAWGSGTAKALCEPVNWSYWNRSTRSRAEGSQTSLAYVLAPGVSVPPTNAARTTALKRAIVGVPARRPFLGCKSSRQHEHSRCRSDSALLRNVWGRVSVASRREGLVELRYTGTRCPARP